MKRSFLPLAALILATLNSGCASFRPVAPASLVGAWRSTLQFNTGAFTEIGDLEFMYVFNAGGTLTESSNYDATPPVPPAYGVWRPVGPREFEAEYEYFATGPPASVESLASGGGWPPAGRGVFTERITLAEDGRSFTSTIRYQPLDPQGRPAEGGGEAEGRGVRIGFVPQDGP